MRYAGKLANRAGETVEVVFRIYSAAEGGEPLWTETQRVPVAQDGSYTVLLGAADPKGLPQQVFAGGVARWLGLNVEQSAEQERVLLASVPYAMKSADAEALAGHAASDFVTQEQLAALTAQGEQPVAPDQNAKPLTSGTITGSGTNGTVALFNGTNTIGNSNIVQSGTEIGINETTPAATLDVGGTETVRGQLTLPSIATATTSNGSPSEPLQLQASAWSTTSNSAGNDTYALQAIPTGNDTASPSSTLYLFHQPAGGSASSILSIANTGLIKFATGQLFPGTLTGALATSPLVAGVAGNNLTLQLNIPTLATSLNSYFPQLSVANTFHASQTVQGGLTVTGNITADNIGATANLTAGVVSLTGSILAATSHVATAAGGFNSPLFEMGASAFNSTSAAAQNETFYWQAVPTGNNTATPSANLQLSFSAGTASPAATGLSIGANGIIHFRIGTDVSGWGAAVRSQASPHPARSPAPARRDPWRWG